MKAGAVDVGGQFLDRREGDGFPGKEALERPGKADPRRDGFIEYADAGCRPADGIQDTPVMVDPEERTAIETELNAETAEAVLDGFIDLVVGKVDELER